MEVTNDLIQRFFKNECNAREAEAVNRHLAENPGIVQRYLGIDDWDSTEIHADMPTELSEEMFHHIKERLLFDRPEIVWWKTKKIKQLAIAASFIFLVVTIWVIGNKGSKDNPLATSPPVLRQTKEHREPANGLSSVRMIEEKNNTGAVRRILLNDGSVVLLDNNSTIKYREYFDSQRREIYLTGQAFFEVAKDKTKLFTVHSGVLATTALGTSFRVSALTGSNNDISVKLFSGKVVIKPIDKLKGWDNNIYLLPGEKMVYNQKRMVATVIRFKQRNIIAVGGPAILAKDLVFDNTPLIKVIDNLRNNYKVIIHYHDKDLEGINFTGTVLKTDSLSVVLYLLANMNGLVFKEEFGSYGIYRSLK